MTHSNLPHSTILALDVGERRIGLALASLAARLPRPFKTLTTGPDTLVELQAIVAQEQVVAVVVGLPRSLDGNSTAQTASVEAFAAELKKALGLPFHWQDEAVTSRQAEAELQDRGKPYVKGDIDALSATYILEDYLRDNPEVKL